MIMVMIMRIMTTAPMSTPMINLLRGLRLVLWAIMVVSGLAVVALSMGWWTPGQSTGQSNGPVIAGDQPMQWADFQASIGGPFSLTTHTGAPFTEADLVGKPTLLFFGFTHCPVICPTTLADISGHLDELGERGDALNAVFVSVDPERDTQQQLSDYLTAFDQRIIALTGPPEAIKAMADAYRVYYQQVPLENGDYTVDHTASVFLLDANARFAGTIAYQEPRHIAQLKIQRLLEVGS